MEKIKIMGTEVNIDPKRLELLKEQAREEAMSLEDFLKINWVWLFCIFDITIAVVAILFIRLVKVYLIILRWPVFLANDFEFVVAGTEPSA